MLHTVNTSPFEKNTLQRCLQFIDTESAVLLIENAVYAATNNTPYTSMLTLALQRHPIYVLLPDLVSRGIDKNTIIKGITPIDYSDFVSLTIQYTPFKAWS